MQDPSQIQASTNVFYVNLPVAERSSWTIYYKRIVPAAKEEEVERSAEPAAKRPRLETTRDSWLYDASVDDPLEKMYRAHNADTAQENFGLAGGKLATMAVKRVDGVLERELWLFSASAPPMVDLPAGLEERPAGSFTFLHLFPSINIGTSTIAAHLMTSNPSFSRAYAAYLAAAHGAVVGSLAARLAVRPGLDVHICGNGLLLTASTEGSESIWCQPTVSLRPQGVVITLTAQPTRFQSLTTTEAIEGGSIILAPIGLAATFVRHVESLPKSHHSIKSSFGQRVQAWVVAKLEALDGVEVVWPLRSCLIESASEEERQRRTKELADEMALERARRTVDIEATAIAASAYIDAVAKERDRERRERAMASVKPAFVGTPGSTSVSTPTPLADDPTGNTSHAGQTPTSATLPEFALANASANSSPVISRFPRSLAPDATAPQAMEVDEPAHMDWSSWPMPTQSFDDIGDQYDTMLGLDDADFSFYDDAGPPKPPSSLGPPVTPSFHDFGASPRFASGSPYFPVSAALQAIPSVSACGVSPSTPGERNGEGKTPFTPFATTADTDQTDPAIGPSPYSPALHPALPLAPLLPIPRQADSGFGPIIFDEDGSLAGLTPRLPGFTPPDSSLLGQKRKRGRSGSQTLRHGLNLRKSSMGGKRQGKDCAICPARWRPMQQPKAVDMGPSPASVDAVSPAFVVTSRRGSKEEVESDGEEEAKVDPASAVPLLGPSLLRMHAAGAAALQEVEKEQTVALAKWTPTNAEEKFRAELHATTVVEGVAACQAPRALQTWSRTSVEIASLLDSKPEMTTLRHITPPQLRCVRRDTVLDLDLDVLPLWNKLDIAPVMSPKAMQGVVVQIEGVGGELPPAVLKSALVRFGELYETLGLGTHCVTPIQLNSDTEGVLRLARPEAGDDAAAHSLKTLGQSIHMAGVKVSRATVFYIVTPTPFSASIFEQCIHALRTLSPRPQFVPLVASSAGELEALFGPAPVGQVNRATQLLIGLFNRLLITIDRLRLKPAAMDEIRWTDSRTYVNACGLPLSFTLPSPSPSRFNFKWPSPQTNILEHDRVLHAAFATSLDRSWLALAIMDDRNEEQTFRCHSLGPPLSSATTEAEQRARTTRVVEVVVRTTMERASMVKIEWTVGFWCVGAMRADEVQTFTAAFEAALKVVRTPMDFTLGCLQLADSTVPAVGLASETGPDGLLYQCLPHPLAVDAAPVSYPSPLSLSPTFPRILSHLSSITLSRSLTPQYLIHLMHRHASQHSHPIPFPLDEAHLRRLTNSLGRLAYHRAALSPSTSTSITMPAVMAIVHLFAQEVRLDFDPKRLA